MYRIMLVDDEEGILHALRRVLASEDYELEIFSKPEEALERAKVGNFDLIISDYRMPKMDGVAFLSQFKEIQPDCVRLILSGYSDLDALIGAINQAQIYRFISKPWHDVELKTIVAQALSHQRSERENKRLVEHVRKQQSQLEQQQKILEKLEVDSPGISHVNWAEDGSIIISEDDL